MSDSSAVDSSSSPIVVAVLMGVSGVGKTTVGKAVARQLGWEFFDGDDFHPDANVEKMSRGVPLTDDDRDGWLDVLTALITRLYRERRPAIVACSALKKKYRDRLRRGSGGAVVVYLRASNEVVEERIRARPGHFFDAGLLDSQYAALEEPEEAITIDATRSFDAVVDAVASHLKRIASTAS